MTTYDDESIYIYTQQVGGSSPSAPTKSDRANRSGMAAIDLSDSRPICVCAMSDRRDLHHVRGVINEVQDPIVAAAR